MGKDIDDKTLQEAKEKLACHIEPPGHSSKAAASGDASGSSIASGGQGSFIDPTGKVLLTQMTSAGG